MADSINELEHLKTENAALKAELQRLAGQDQQAAEASDRRRKVVLTVGWSLLFPLFDRKKIVRSFMQLFNTTSGFANPREAWPEREELLADAQQFALSVLRFAIRRRTFMLIIGLVATLIPGIQIWLVYKQNEIIENQNRFFEIDVYDTTARGLTSGTVSSRQVTAALLAKVDLELLRGMVDGVFEGEIGGEYTATDVGAPVRRMQAAAFRGYLIQAVARQIREHGENMDPGELNREVYPIFESVIRDAQRSVPEILRTSRSAATQNAELGEEVSNYLFGLVGLMRTIYSLAVAVDEEEKYFATIAALVDIVAKRSSSERNPFEEFFFRGAMPELLLDFAQQPKFGEEEPEFERGTVGKLTKEGFERLKAGIGEQSSVDWSNLKRRMGVR